LTFARTGKSERVGAGAEGAACTGAAASCCCICGVSFTAAWVTGRPLDMAVEGTAVTCARFAYWTVLVLIWLMLFTVRVLVMKLL
jgi:hypothetical protein